MSCDVADSEIRLDCLGSEMFVNHAASMANCYLVLSSIQQVFLDCVQLVTVRGCLINKLCVTRSFVVYALDSFCRVSADRVYTMAEASSLSTVNKRGSRYIWRKHSNCDVGCIFESLHRL